jgi:hypothetical protein|tara:strand:+ start:1639 stop:1800 length:162 start_codon:yes stop_codon:yes gene_type:complete
MTQRVSLYLENDFAEELRDSKPKALSLSAWCALLAERALAKELQEKKRQEQHG